jgi:hypothetical protein
MTLFTSMPGDRLSVRRFDNSMVARHALAAQATSAGAYSMYADLGMLAAANL